MVDVTFYFRI